MVWRAMRCCLSMGNALDVRMVRVRVMAPEDGDDMFARLVEAFDPTGWVRLRRFRGRGERAVTGGTRPLTVRLGDRACRRSARGTGGWCANGRRLQGSN